MITKYVILLPFVTVTFGVNGVEPANADNYPSHPITIVVGYSAGGPTDTIARIMAERMRMSLGQTLVVENVTGASGSLGVGRVARAVPDGYTLSIGDWSTHVANGAIYALPYDLLKNLQPVALLPSNPMLVLAKKALPAADLRELIAWLKANQDKALEGTAGTGSPGTSREPTFRTSSARICKWCPTVARRRRSWTLWPA